jgi:tRNA(Ile)-lysidine synthase
VLPELLALNPQALQHINQTGERMRELRDYMDEQTDICAKKALLRRGDARVLSVEALQNMPRALRMRLLHRAVSEAAGARKDIAGTHLSDVEQLLWKQSGRRVDLPYGIVARRVYDEIVLESRRREDRQPECLEVDPGQLLEGEEVVLSISGAQFRCRVFPFYGNVAKIPRKVYTKWLDYDKIKGKFSIRTRRAGDFFILDAAGHRKKLVDYFVDEKIPAHLRDHYLLVTQASRVLWVVGGRMGFDAGVTKDTRRVLEMTCLEPSQLRTEGGTHHGLQ